MQGAFLKQRQDTTGLINQFGTDALLRRAEGDRPCKVFFSGFASIEMMGREAEPSIRRVLVAATDEILLEPPDHDVDRLITLDSSTYPPTELENLRITEPAIPAFPNGEIAFWHLNVRR